MRDACIKHISVKISLQLQDISKGRQFFITASLLNNATLLKTEMYSQYDNTQAMNTKQSGEENIHSFTPETFPSIHTVLQKKEENFLKSLKKQCTAYQVNKLKLTYAQTLNLITPCSKARINLNLKKIIQGFWFWFLVTFATVQYFWSIWLLCNTFLPILVLFDTFWDFFVNIYFFVLLVFFCTFLQFLVFF